MLKINIRGKFQTLLKNKLFIKTFGLNKLKKEHGECRVQVIVVIEDEYDCLPKLDAVEDERIRRVCHPHTRNLEK